ncbi:MAG TPA: carboxypeptidase regulatory-like domain-containing protein [Polyangiales bacterium]
MAALLSLSTGVWLLWPRPQPAPAPAGAAPMADAAVGSPAPVLPHRLRGERVLTGRVLDDRNQPLLEARVRVSSLDDADALPWEASTNVEGRFELHDLVAHALAIEVSHPGHDATEHTLRPDDNGELLFTLARQGELRVKLRAAPGQGVEGALVTLTGPGLWPAAQLRASATGEVLFENLALGEYQARAVYAEQAAPPSTKVRVVPGERTELALTLAQALALSLVVVDRTAGAVIADAELSLYDTAPSIPPRAATSDAQGAALFVGLLPGAQRLEVRHPGHAPRSLDLTLPIAGGALRVELDGEAALSGVVVDERGEPLRGAQLSVSTRDGLPVQLAQAGDARASGPGELGVTRGPVPRIPLAVSSDPAIGTLASESDAQGAFRITGLPPSPLIVSAARSGFALGHLEVADLTPHAERSGLRIVLREAGRVEGSLRDARDHPVVGVYVAAHSADGAQHSAITDADGRFTLLDLVGEVRVSAEAQGYAPLGCSLVVQPRQTLRCDLVVGSTLYELPVRVVDDFDFGLEGAVVSVQPRPGARVITQVTRRDGGAVLRELPEPPYVVHVEAPGFVTTSSEVLRLERELKIKLAKAGNLAGHVTDSIGRAVPYALVSTEDGTVTGSSDLNGDFLLSGVAPGATLVLAAHRSVGEGTSAQVRARPGETLEGVRIVLSGRYLPGRDEPAPTEAARAAGEPTAASDLRTKPSEFELVTRAGEIVFGAVQPGTPVERAGVRAGDVLLSIDGELVRSAAQGRGMLRDPAGQTALIQLRRDRAQARVRYRRPAL